MVWTGLHFLAGFLAGAGLVGGFGQHHPLLLEAVARGDAEALLRYVSDVYPQLQDPFDWPGSAELRSLAFSLRRAAAGLAPALAATCLGPRLAAAAPPPIAGLEAALQQGDAELLREARRLQSLLQAPAPVLKLVASVAQRTELEGSMSPDCRMLRAGFARGQCNEIANVGLACIESLAEAAQRLETVGTWAIGGPQQIARKLRWQWRSDFGVTREEGLEALLRQQQQTLGDRDLNMAEIGVWYGDVSAHLLAEFQNLHMLLVDPYHLRAEGVAEDQPQGLPVEALDIGTRRTQPFRYRATHLLQHSVEAAGWVSRNSMDIVYVDGDHSYEGVASDLNAWWPILRDGGAMVGHDYTITWPGVVRAVNEFADVHGLDVNFSAELWWFLKSRD
ncbi:unnamed protein product [Symbiodinium natans]|uniref:Class I SAM-dependent methyltransferase n=1 Tax=Symbiodinium natans TaxID=878477 RepID=A0A812Q2L2_9DINO|nr:unnamed protein product [Symbiodinium natans]